MSALFSNRVTRRALKLLLLLAVYLPFLAATSSGPELAAVPEFSQRINAFTFDYLRRAAESGAANGVVSPRSVFDGMAMSYVASGGATRRELAAALHFPPENATLEQGLAQSKLGGAGGGKGVELSIANAGWLDDSHALFQPGYLDTLRRMGMPSLNHIHFGDKTAAAQQINAWVQQYTGGKIAGSVKPGDLAWRSGPGVVNEPGLVLVNAVYMKGEWLSGFDPARTAPRDFHTASGTVVKTPAMQHQGAMLYATDADFQFIEMPYRGGEFSMVVLLPVQQLPPARITAMLTPEKIIAFWKASTPANVDLEFPKFSTQLHTDAKRILTAMGVKSAFDSGSADFDAMIVKKPDAYRVYLSAVYHDAWVQVGEEGTEAAAVSTGAHFSVGCSAAPQPRDVVFHADHPFTYFIVHKKSRSILFAGWVGNPAEP